MQQVTVLCTDPRHPVNEWLARWCEKEAGRAQCRVVRDVSEATGGDFLFLVSCHQIVNAQVRAGYRFALVLHASDLPHGRGMSPHIWQILEGRNEIPLSLLNAEDALDSGDIWRQDLIRLEGGELFDEINAAIFESELKLMTWALENCDSAKPRPQTGTGSYYRRRKPEDSRIDPSKPLSESFDLLRVADPDRYPAFFDWAGRRYKIRIERA